MNHGFFDAGQKHYVNGTAFSSEDGHLCFLSVVSYDCFQNHHSASIYSPPPTHVQSIDSYFDFICLPLHFFRAVFSLCDQIKAPF